MDESFSKKLFGGTVVWGCVEGADAGVEGLRDDGVRGEVESGGVVEVVEGCGAADERGKSGGERWLGRRHFVDGLLTCEVCLRLCEDDVLKEILSVNLETSNRSRGFAVWIWLDSRLYFRMTVLLLVFSQASCTEKNLQRERNNIIVKLQHSGQGGRIATTDSMHRCAWELKIKSRSDRSWWGNMVLRPGT